MLCPIEFISSSLTSKDLKCVCISQQRLPRKCRDYVFESGHVQMATPRSNVHRGDNKALGVVFGQGMLYVFFLSELGQIFRLGLRSHYSQWSHSWNQMSTGSSCIPFTFPANFTLGRHFLKVWSLENINPMMQAEETFYAEQTSAYHKNINFKVWRSTKTFTNQPWESITTTLLAMEYLHSNY